MVLKSHLPLALQAFQTMAKRESIKRAVERKTADFQRLFIDDLNMVKKQFDLLKRVPPADPVLPRYAGQATVALVLAKRVDHTWQALQVATLLLHVCLKTDLPGCYAFRFVLTVGMALQTCCATLRPRQSDVLTLICHS